MALLWVYIVLLNTTQTVSGILFTPKDCRIRVPAKLCSGANNRVSVLSFRIRKSTVPLQRVQTPSKSTTGGSCGEES